MAKRRSMKSFQKAGSLKKLSATFISLALLFVISIVLHFAFNKQFREGAANMNEIYLEVSIIYYKDPVTGIVIESCEDTTNLSRLQTYFKDNKKMYIGSDNSSRIDAYKLPSSTRLTAGDYPIGVLSSVSTTNGRNNKTHFTKIRNSNFVNNITPYIPT